MDLSQEPAKRESLPEVDVVERASDVRGVVGPR